MKAILVFYSIAFIVMLVSGLGNSAGVTENGKGIRCESTEGCCTDPLDCPGCCNPPYDNQCTKIKGESFSLCELTGTFFYPLANYPSTFFEPFYCITLSIASNYPGKCQTTGWFNSKKKNMLLKNGTLVWDKTFYPSYPIPMYFHRSSSCGQFLVHPREIFPGSALEALFEPFDLQLTIVKRNSAGFAIVYCFAIENSPVVLAYALTYTPNPLAYELQELADALKPYAGYGKLYNWSYEGCFPNLTTYH